MADNQAIEARVEEKRDSYLCSHVPLSTFLMVCIGYTVFIAVLVVVIMMLIRPEECQTYQQEKHDCRIELTSLEVLYINKREEYTSCASQLQECKSQINQNISDNVELIEYKATRPVFYLGIVFLGLTSVGFTIYYCYHNHHK